MKTMCKVMSLVLTVAMVMALAVSGGAAYADNTIKIGWLGPLTGGVAQYGEAVKSGVDLYVEQLNAAGGINGKKVELVAYDEEGDSAKAIAGYSSLMDAGVVAIVGSVTTAPTIAVVSEAFADNIPMITASATAIGVTYNADADQVYTNMFRSCFIDSFQGVTMSRFAKEELGAKTAAVLYDNGDTWILCDAIAAAEESGAKPGSDAYSEAVIAAMSATDKEFVTGHVRFDDHNDPQKTAAIIQITDGAESFWGNF